MYEEEITGESLMKKIAFVTGSRADYGIVRRYLDLLNKDDDIDLKILVTGALLSETYGNQVKLIYEDGFDIAAEIKVDLDSSSNKMILHTMAQTMEGFADHFATNRYDLLIILGDRYEMLSVATAAAMQQLPILHIHGAEATYGNYDEFIRHAITKMSLYHFTATEEYRKRVIQLGEQPDKVFYLGALGAENCLYMDEKNVPDFVKCLPERKYFVILFHPETLTNRSTLEQIKELLCAISKFKDYQFVFLGTNADTHSDIIRNTIKLFVEENDNTLYFENLHPDAYHYLLKKGICLIGNSSSGIIEAPSLGIYTINIGDRQNGRVRGNSVIDIKCESTDIGEAIENVLSYNTNIEKIVNPYYQKDTACHYYTKTKELLSGLESDISEPKRFYDI